MMGSPVSSSLVCLNRLAAGHAAGVGEELEESVLVASHLGCSEVGRRVPRLPVSGRIVDDGRRIMPAWIGATCRDRI